MAQSRNSPVFLRTMIRCRFASPFRRLLPWLGLVGCCLCTPVEMHAQDRLVLAAADVGEEKLLLQDIPSVFTASKYEQKVTQAPSSISIVTADEIRKFGYRTLADILRSVRGFYTSYDRNYTYVGVRGFNRPGDYNTRILLMIDGHRLNDTVYDSALVGTEFPLDMDLIERVEIVRGPSSSLYGNNAFFAVVNVITRRGREMQVGEASGSVQRYGTYTGRVTLGRRFENGFEGIASGSIYTSQGKQQLFFPEFDDPATNNGIAEGLDGDDAYQFFTTLSYKNFTFQGLYGSRTKQIPTAPFDTLFNDPRTQTRDAQGYADLKYETTLGTHWDILGRLYYDRYYYNGHYPYVASGLNIDTAVGNRVGGEAQVTTRALPRNIITSGVQIDYSPDREQQNYDQDPYFLYLNSNSQSTHWGIFAQDEFTILDNLLLNAGVRYDKYEDFDGTVSPRIALIYNPLRDSVVKFVYGTAFRNPNVYERFYDAPGQKGNPGLQPEKISTYELILEQYLWGVLRLTAIPFYYDVKNLINQETDPDDGLLVFRNVGHVTSVGVETEVEAKWGSGWNARAAYTYQYTKNKDTGTQLSDSPYNVAQFNLIAPIWKEKLFGGLEIQYVGDRTAYGGAKVGGKVIANLTLFSTDLLVKGLAMSASVYNLFDTTYKNPVSDAHVMQSINQDGIGFRFKLTYTY